MCQLWLLHILACAQKDSEQIHEEFAHIELSSDSATAFLSCMADYPQLVNPIIFWAYSVEDGEDYCQDGVYGIRLYFNDEPFLSNPLGFWQFTGTDGYLSLDPNDDTPRYQSQLDEFRESENETEFCIGKRTSFVNVNLHVAHWDWISFDVTYEGLFENGDTVAGRLNGYWRDDINDCD